MNHRGRQRARQKAALDEFDKRSEKLMGNMAGGPFDWSGVLVGHWIVESVQREHKMGIYHYRAISHCGVRALHTAHSLASGCTQTCVACRVHIGAEPPANRVVIREEDLPAFRKMWGEICLDDERSALVSNWAKRDHPARVQWNECGFHGLQSVILTSGLGLDFGWKYTIRAIGGLLPEAPRDIRIESCSESKKSISLRLQLPFCDYFFDVILTTGRTDQPFSEIVRKLQDALATVNPNMLLRTEELKLKLQPQPQTENAMPENKPADKPVHGELKGGVPTQSVNIPLPAPQSSANGKHADPATVLGKFSSYRISKMRDGLDRLITISADVEEAKRIKAEALECVTQAKAALAPIEAKLATACEKSNRAVAARAEAGELVQRITAQINRLQIELEKAEGQRTRAEAEKTSACETRDQVIKEVMPYRESVAKAEADLVEAEKLEADRLASAAELSPLLDILSKLAN